MTPPTEKYEPTPEQVEEVSNKLARHLATDVCPKLKQMVEWHLVQLHRETEKLRLDSERDVIAKTGDLRDEALRIKAELWRSESAKENAQRDISTLRSQLDALKGLLNRHHDNQKKSCTVYFDHNGTAGDVPFDLGEIYSEGSLAKETDSALTQLEAK